MAETPETSAARRLNLERARIAAAGFCMQLALGAINGWSVFLKPLQ